MIFPRSRNALITVSFTLFQPAIKQYFSYKSDRFSFVFLSAIALFSIKPGENADARPALRLLFFS